MDQGISMRMQCQVFTDYEGCGSYHNEVMFYFILAMIMTALSIFVLTFIIVKRNTLKKKVSYFILLFLILVVASTISYWKHYDLTTIHCVKSGMIEEC